MPAFLQREGTQPMYRQTYLVERARPGSSNSNQNTQRRRQLQPFFFHMGPVALSITSVLLIALMAVLYLSQLSQAVAANQEMQNMHAEQATLQRQNQDLVSTLAQEQSPFYIVEHAKALGLVPSDPKNVQILIAPHLKPFTSHGGPIEP